MDKHHTSLSSNNRWERQIRSLINFFFINTKHFLLAVSLSELFIEELLKSYEQDSVSLSQQNKIDSVLPCESQVYSQRGRNPFVTTYRPFSFLCWITLAVLHDCSLVSVNSILAISDISSFYFIKDSFLVTDWDDNSAKSKYLMNFNVFLIGFKNCYHWILGV